MNTRRLTFLAVSLLLALLVAWGIRLHTQDGPAETSRLAASPAPVVPESKKVVKDFPRRAPALDAAFAGSTEADPLAPPHPWAAYLKARNEMEAKLRETTVDLDCENKTLVEVLAEVEAKLGFRLGVDIPADVAAKPITFKTRDLAAIHTLRLLAAQYGGTLVYAENGLPWLIPEDREATLLPHEPSFKPELDRMIAVSDGLRATKAPAEAQSQAIRDRMSSIKISLNFTDTPLPEVVSFMSEVTQLNMVIDRKLIEDPDAKTVTFRVDELAFDQALDLIMKMANLGTQVQDGVVVITSREKVEADAAKAAAEKKALSEARKAQEELLARPVAFGGENLPLRDVADILAKGLGVPYRIDPKTWARPARYTIEERQRPASEIVALLRKGAPLVVAYREGILWFLSPDGVR